MHFCYVPKVLEAELDEDSGSNPCRWRGAEKRNLWNGLKRHVISCHSAFHAMKSQPSEVGKYIAQSKLFWHTLREWKFAKGGETVESNSKSISTVALGSLIQEHVWVACQPAMSSIRTDLFMISFKSQSIKKYQSNGITSSSMDEKLLMNAKLDDCIDVKTYRMALLMAQKILQHLSSWQIGYKKTKRFQLGFIPYITC